MRRTHRPGTDTAWLTRLAGLAVGYFVLVAWVTAQFGDHPPLRLANALALVYFLRQPLPRWPQLVAVVFLAGIVGREASGAASPVVASLCNTFEVLAAAGIVHVAGGLQSPWYRGVQVPRLLLAWLLVPLVSGALGAAFVDAQDGADLLRHWMTWYVASALGLLVLTPLLLSWSDPWIRAQSLPRATFANFAGMTAGIGAALALLLQEFYPPLVLMTFPLILLMTWAYRLMGATLLLACAGAAGLWSVLEGRGSLVQMALPATDLVTRIQALQLYLAALVTSSLPFAALLLHQRKLRADLRRSNQARSEFLAAMSHEIRTPMTGVLGMADMLATENLTARQAGFVQSIRASGRHLLAVINDILDFSRIETGKLPLEDIDFSLPEVLEQLRSLMHPLAQDRGIAFEIELAPHSPPIVRGDPTRLRQILLNLTSNAIKFTPQGSVRIVVNLLEESEAGVRLAFEVRDTGVGIPPETLARLFTAFTQADRSTAREYGGSGLGLAICKRLAHAMGGTIRAESAQGAGSVFTLELPMGIGDSARLLQAAADAVVPLAPRRILVAEDVEINREVLRAALERQGHTLVFAHTGAEAVERVQAEPFDLVLMDVQMPVMDGVEATRRIRALPGPVSRIPIIGLTANVMAQEQERYLAAGMDDCQMKPIDWTLLAASITRHAGGAPDDVSAPAAAAVPQAKPPQDPALTPLIDERQLAGLRAIASEEECAAMLAAGFTALQATLAEIEAGGAPAFASSAHKMKGAAGTLGFARVSAIAGLLEARANAGEDGSALVDQLRAAMDATGASLHAPAAAPSAK